MFCSDLTKTTLFTVVMGHVMDVPKIRMPAAAIERYQDIGANSLVKNVGLWILQHAMQEANLLNCKDQTLTKRPFPNIHQVGNTLNSLTVANLSQALKAENVT